MYVMGMLYLHIWGVIMQIADNGVHYKGSKLKLFKTNV